MKNKTKEEVKKEMDAIQEASKPLMKLLADNYHPHVKTIITSTSIEVVEGMITIPEILEFIKD